MARRGNRRGGAIGPVIGIVALTALVTVSATMLVSGNRSGGIAGLGADVSGAIGSVVAMPVRWYNGGASAVHSFFGGSALNRQLKAENANLLVWREQARAMADRLDAYEKLNTIAGEQLVTGLTGRLVGESAGPFSRSGIVNVGAKAGVQVNWIVLNQNGLVGRVIAVGNDTSRVLLLGDGDSRVPVMGEATRARAIATGDKTPAPRLAHLNTPPLMRDGEQLLTSGDDGIFPRGISVGQAGVAPDRQWRVRLASNRGPIDFVRLVPPSNFPPPLDPVTPPPLDAPPTGASQSVSVVGGVLPLAPNAAPVPTAATPEAIRAAQTDLARKSAQQVADLRKLLAERDAARDSARRAETARVAAERRANGSAARATSKAGSDGGKGAVRKEKKLDPSAVPVAPSALIPATPIIKTPEPAPTVEGPTK